MKKSKRGGIEDDKKDVKKETSTRTTRGVKLGNLNENALSKKSLDAEA